MAFRLLAVPNFQLPTTYVGWQGVSGQELAAIKDVWTALLHVDIHDSKLYEACPGAFTASQVGGRSVAPLHEVEYLLTRFLRASNDILIMPVGEIAVTPATLSAVEAFLRNPGDDVTAFDFSACTPTVLLRRLIQFSAAHAHPPALTVGRDDLIGLEAVPRNNIGVNWPSLMPIQSLMEDAGGLAPFADFCGLVGSRGYQADRAAAGSRFRAMSAAVRSMASIDFAVDDVLAGDVTAAFISSTVWPSALIRHVRTGRGDPRRSGSRRVRFRRLRTCGASHHAADRPHHRCVPARPQRRQAFTRSRMRQLHSSASQQSRFQLSQQHGPLDDVHRCARGKLAGRRHARRRHAERPRPKLSSAEASPRRAARLFAGVDRVLISRLSRLIVFLENERLRLGGNP